MKRLAVLALLLAGCTVNATGTAGVDPAPKPSATPSAAASPKASAGPSPAASPMAAALPAPGATVDQAFWKAHHPAVVKGTRWTYVTAFAYQSRPGDETPYDSVAELTAIAGDVLTFTFTDQAPGGAAAPRTETVTGAVGPLVPDAAAKYAYMGQEKVTVPLGTYPEALKLVAADRIDGATTIPGGTVWLVPEMGVVKAVSNGDYHLRRELKAVAKP